MRIWQRRAIACTSAPVLSVIVSANDRVGVAAYRSALAPVQPKTRSAIDALLGCQRQRPAPQAGQERRQRGVRLGAAVEPLPAQPELAHQRVALVDRQQEDLAARLGP